MRSPWTNTDPKVGGGKLVRDAATLVSRKKTVKDPNVLYDGV